MNLRVQVINKAGIKWIKAVFCFILILFYQTKADAQPPEYREKPRKVKMPKYYKAYLEPKSLAFSEIAVIQTVWDSTTLGYLDKGMLNIIADAIPEKDMTEFLQDYVNSQYKEYFKKSGKKLLMLFKNLRVSEKTFFSRERAYAIFNAEAYISEDGVSYKLSAAIDSVLIMQGAADLTYLHGQNITEGILELLKRCLNNGLVTLASPGPGLTREEIRNKSMAAYDHKILKTQTINEGAFMSFQEFLNNAPSVTVFETQVAKEETLKIYSSQDGLKTEINPWGICKQGEMYKLHEGMLIPIERKGDGFIISDYVERSRRRNNRLAFAGFFGGVLGVAIANKRNPEKLFPVTQFSYIPKQQPDASAIDMKTGELSF